MRSRKKINQRAEENNVEMSKLDEGIQTERAGSLKHAEQETGPIREKLREHRELLEKQVEERSKHHSEFTSTLNESFRRIRQKLQKESAAQNAQCMTSKSQAEERFNDLKTKQKKQESVIQARLVDIKQRLAHENQERSKALHSIISNMSQFMDEFTKSTDTSFVKQQETQELLRTSMRNIQVE